MQERVDVPSLEAYVIKGVDRRQAQALAYLAEVKATGAPTSDGTIWTLERVYRRKTVDGHPSGRLYGPALSLQTLTREARAAACASFSVDIDMVNAFVAILSQMFGGSLPGNIHRGAANRGIALSVPHVLLVISLSTGKELSLIHI